MSHLRPLVTRTLAVLGIALGLLCIELRRTVPSGPAVQHARPATAPVRPASAGTTTSEAVA